DRGGGDAVGGVVRLLHLAPSGGFVHGVPHRAGDDVGVEDGAAVDVPRRTTDGLYQRTGRSQEPFLVGIEHGDERHLRKVEALAQQVDADEHVEGAAPQIAQNLDALERVDVAV